jgi:hypothetical protein
MLSMRGRVLVGGSMICVSAMIVGGCGRHADAQKPPDAAAKASAAYPKSRDSGAARPPTETAGAARTLVPQKTCPVMGTPIDKRQYVDALGKRIYVCCPDCIAPVKKDPAAYIAKLHAMGEEVEDIPVK